MNAFSGCLIFSVPRELISLGKARHHLRRCLMPRINGTVGITPDDRCRRAAAITCCDIKRLS